MSSNSGGGGGGSQMINPHNPEFLTKKPWYLTEKDEYPTEEPTLDHQSGVLKNEQELSLAAADRLLKDSRRKFKEQQRKQKFNKGQWVEALKRNKPPYRICKIVKMNKKQTEFDLEYEDGTIEKRVKFNAKKQMLFKTRPRIRMTKSGNRSADVQILEANQKESYAGKRDQYHGFSADQHNATVAAKFERREAVRRKMRNEERKKKQEQEMLNNSNSNNNDNETKERNSDSDADSDSDVDSDVENSGDDSDEEFVQRDEDDKVITTRLARQGGVGGAEMKVTARNLRIREDTAKYLRNLNPESAYYDPKSRSMRDNPNPELGPDQAAYVGDNALRVSGDAVQLAQTQLFAWDAESKGVGEIHPQANPSQAELLKKQFKSKTTDLKRAKQLSVLQKYGGTEYFDGDAGLAKVAAESTTKASNSNNDGRANKKIRFGVSTAQEAYSRDGKLIASPSSKNKRKREALLSKYEEDIFINGHTTTWGSYFHKGAFTWGYGDDHSLIKNSYGTGDAGRQANDEANEIRYGTGEAGSAALAQARGMLRAMPKNLHPNKDNNNSMLQNRSKLYGEADPKAELDQDKVRRALEKSKSQQNADTDDRKRKYHSLEAEPDITEEDMEAYRLQKEAPADPMANIASDQLLEYKK